MSIVQKYALDAFVEHMKRAALMFTLVPADGGQALNKALREKMGEWPIAMNAASAFVEVLVCEQQALALLQEVGANDTEDGGSAGDPDNESVGKTPS